VKHIVSRENNKHRTQSIAENVSQPYDILNALPFYVLLVDENHHIIFGNKAVLNELKLEPKAIVGKYCPKAVHGLDHPYSGCPLEEAAENNKAVEKEFYDSSTGRWVISAIYPANKYTEDGKRIFLHMVSDITKRKQAEENLKDSHQKLRNLSAYLETVEEEERKKIARDLHDETSQLLASLTAHLETAIRMIDLKPQKVKETLKNAQAISTSIIDQLHKSIYELRPLILDDLGLVPALNWLIDNSIKVYKIKAVFKKEGSTRRLPRQIETSIFRVIQEAMSNITRHAKAKHVEIIIQFRKSKVKVRVIDDGNGFNIQEASILKDNLRGFGLLGMRERIDAIGGQFDIKSHIGIGTVINFEIPVK
jgi:PAS domain S-box-containing protein